MNKETLTSMINDEKAVGYLATIDGEQPRVRPISAKFTSGKLMFSTFAQSNKMHQIETNNKIEMAWMFPDQSHLRVQATIETVTDTTTKREYLDAWPMLKEFFKDENDSNYTLLELKPSRVYYNKFGDMEYCDIDW